MHKFYRAAGLFSPAFFCASVFLATVAVSWAPAANAQAMLLPTTELQIGPHKVTAEIAATDASRSYGLMNRASLPADHGMLFVFDGPSSACFWMKNTPLPLSIAFVDAAGKIVNIADMQPHSETAHCPKEPVPFALEMSQGWFRQHAIKPGATVSRLPRPRQ